MADIKKLYFDLISDYDPYYDIEQDRNLTESDMLYGLICIRDLNGIENYDNEEEKKLYHRFISLIDLMQSLGIKPSH